MCDGRRREKCLKSHLHLQTDDRLLAYLGSGGAHECHNNSHALVVQERVLLLYVNKYQQNEWIFA